MKKAVLYIHGRGGNAEEAVHYRPLFPDRTVLGLDYRAETPREARREFAEYFDGLCREYGAVSLVANSIGAFFALTALGDRPVECAYLISPVADLEALTLRMMAAAGVTEEALRERKTVETSFGETLSWEVLQDLRSHPLRWTAPTHILRGETDSLIPLNEMAALAEATGATLDVMPGGEHWFHTAEQMAFLDKWIGKY